MSLKHASVLKQDGTLLKGTLIRYCPVLSLRITGRCCRLPRSVFTIRHSSVVVQFGEIYSTKFFHDCCLAGLIAFHAGSSPMPRVDLDQIVSVFEDANTFFVVKLAPLPQRTTTAFGLIRPLFHGMDFVAAALR